MAQLEELKIVPALPQLIEDELQSIEDLRDLLSSFAAEGGLVRRRPTEGNNQIGHLMITMLKEGSKNKLNVP